MLGGYINSPAIGAYPGAMGLVLMGCGLFAQMMIPGAMEFIRHGLNLMGAWFIIPIAMKYPIMGFHVP